MTDKIVIFCTCSTGAEAGKIARLLVDNRLAACVNILPQIRSIYRWQGTIEDTTEVLLLVKSKLSLFERIRREIQAAHSYEVPEVIAIPIAEGAAPYLDWLDRETEGG
jgi:periplasmic divalent cation tolerance protein